MSFNGHNQQQKREVQLRPDDIVIPIMGATGSGKSTFIWLLADGPSAVIGHSLKGYTKSIKIYPYHLTPKTRLILLDTPSFTEASSTTDTDITDTITLRSLASILCLLHTNNIKLGGLIYLHDITTTTRRRPSTGGGGGAQQRSLRMFKKLIGTENLSNTILVTTMWGNLTAYREGAGREKLLRDKYWESMLARGSVMMRHSGSRRSAEQIVKTLLRRSTGGSIVLDIQREMVLQRRRLSDTGVGRELDCEMRGERDRCGKEIAALRKEIEDVGRGRDGGRALRESRAARLREKIRVLEEGRRALRVDFQRLRGEVEEQEGEGERRKKKGFGKTALGIGIGTIFGLTTGIFF
ncbi:hypothetical protein FQN50_003031 [Emmonsiellopsis sp. PD_5]|nr:hypothetical protein FQN50_003031 [Emmonsiellopsis sp. PD_5]